MIEHLKKSKIGPKGNFDWEEAIVKINEIIDEVNKHDS